MNASLSVTSSIDRFVMYCVNSSYLSLIHIFELDSALPHNAPQGWRATQEIGSPLQIYGSFPSIFRCAQDKAHIPCLNELAEAALVSQSAYMRCPRPSFMFPSILTVLGMRQDRRYKNDPKAIVDARDEPIMISFYINHCVFADHLCRRICLSYICLLYTSLPSRIHYDRGFDPGRMLARPVKKNAPPERGVSFCLRGVPIAETSRKRPRFGSSRMPSRNVQRLRGPFADC